MAMLSSPEAPQPLARVISEVKAWVERLGDIWVEGQIIELRRRVGAGIHFITLRDRRVESSATLTCRTFVLDQAGPLTEGAQVVALIRPRVREKNSSLTFECTQLRLRGEGQLLAELERLKQRLQAEGLFDQGRKRPLPLLPKKIGLIAGQDSDAAKDVHTHIRNRWPGATIRFVPALVQGTESVASLIRALNTLDEDDEVEVIIIARGGGSLEDLLSFSDEGLIRAVARTTTPVISAIGHEADSPILDLVADQRASTPTDAAKYVVPDAGVESELLDQTAVRLCTAIDQRLSLAERELAELCSRPVLRDPRSALEPHFEKLSFLETRLGAAVDRRLAEEELALEHALSSVRNISPGATLQRGYSILVNASGEAVLSADQVNEDQVLHAHLGAGELDLVVSSRKFSAQTLEALPTRGESEQENK